MEIGDPYTSKQCSSRNYENKNVIDLFDLFTIVNRSKLSTGTLVYHFTKDTSVLIHFIHITESKRNQM
jgi:hypothetical protein